MIPTLTFFNNKGGVGKTTLLYHLAWTFNDMGKRTLIADLDPQANLTSMFLAPDDLEEIWNPDQKVNPTIMQSLEPRLQGLGDIDPAPLRKVSENLYLIPGDLALQNFESMLSEQWGKCLEGDPTAFRVTSSFHRIMQEAASRTEAELIMIDVGPNFGAINRAALISSDYIVVPLAPDLFSIQGLRNLGPTLKKWRKDWNTRKGQFQDGSFSLPEGNMNPIGYTVVQFGVRDSRQVKAYETWSSRIPEVYRDNVLYDTTDDQKVFSYGEDENCLGLLKHYRSLMPMAMEARKPIFHLRAADGALGAHTTAAQNCGKDFEKLASRVLEEMKKPKLMT